MKKILFLFFTVIVLSGCNTVPYKETVSTWKSHEDVASWLDNNFSFSKWRQQEVQQRLKRRGAGGLLARNPETLFHSSSGYCVDAANFAIYHLNMIDPAYNARWVFISNDMGRPHHWVAAFDYNEKLYIMDYGAGPKWNAMKGVHGPYNDLLEYRDYLRTLSLPGMKVGSVYYRDMPGDID